MSTFLVILTKIKQIFLYVTTNICYNSAKPYMIHQRGHLLDKTNLSRGKWVKYGPFNPLLAVTQKNDFFFSNLFFNSIIGHAFSRIDNDVNTLIERHIASYCRWIKRVDGSLAQNIYKTRRFVIILTTTKNTFCLLTSLNVMSVPELSYCISVDVPLMPKSV